MVKNTANMDDPVTSELMAIKRLMVLALIRDGVSQGTIASALGVSEATISRMFPKGMAKTLKSGRE
ncbi:MAG: helix-turn-helix domain-containing protein [Planctomycetes bacterium]|nr:helix-turn-helix domain-containing protein [Planctomycetota bacterium]